MTCVCARVCAHGGGGGVTAESTGDPCGGICVPFRCAECLGPEHEQLC